MIFNQKRTSFSLGLLLLTFAIATPALSAEAETETLPPYVELKQPVEDIIWRPDGQMLAVAVANDVWLYTPEFEEVAHLEGHTDVVTSVSWNWDGTRLASGSQDTTILIWDMRPGATFGDTLMKLQTEGFGVARVAWSPVANDNRLASSAVERMESGSDWGVIYYKVTIWDTDTGEVEYTLPEYNDVRSLSWSPDGKQLATSGFLFREDGYAVRIWDIQSGQLQSTLQPNLGEFEINDIDWSVTNQIAIANELASIPVSDPVTTEEIFRFHPPDIVGLTRLDWNSDASQLATSGEDGSINIWDVHTAELLQTFQAHQGYILGLEWSPDDTKLASASYEEGSLKIWDVGSIDTG